MEKSTDFGFRNSDFGKDEIQDTRYEHCDMEWLELAMNICYMDMLILVGQVLLALRHPDNNGPSTHIARKLIRTMARKLVERFPDQIPEEVLDEWRREGLV